MCRSTPAAYISDSSIQALQPYDSYVRCICGSVFHAHGTYSNANFSDEIRC